MALTGNVKNAESAFEKATELQPTNPLGYYSLGLLAEQQGNLGAAVALYRKSVEADPEFANGYFNLGAIHANAGDYEKAIEAMNMVLKLQPHAQDARRMLRQIQQEQAKQQR
jgi:tetratricopeptide (TPR) repeat protein